MDNIDRFGKKSKETTSIVGDNKMVTISNSTTQDMLRQDMILVKGRFYPINDINDIDNLIT